MCQSLFIQQSMYAYINDISIPAYEYMLPTRLNVCFYRLYIPSVLMDSEGVDNNNNNDNYGHHYDNNNDDDYHHYYNNNDYDYHHYDDMI
jgi:hypothetical protein